MLRKEEETRIRKISDSGERSSFLKPQEVNPRSWNPKGNLINLVASNRKMHESRLRVTFSFRDLSCREKANQ